MDRGHKLVLSPEMRLNLHMIQKIRTTFFELLIVVIFGEAAYCMTLNSTVSAHEAEKNKCMMVQWRTCHFGLSAPLWEKNYQ